MARSKAPARKQHKCGIDFKSGAGQGILHAFEPAAPSKSAGCSIIIPKLKDLVPVLVNCFRDFIPELITTQSFDCMLSTLNSINLAVKFIFYMTDVGKLESQPSQGGLDATLWGDAISMTPVKKFLQVLFPLNMTNQLSEKIFLARLATEIFVHLSKCICPPVLLEKVLEFLEDSLLGKAFSEAFKDCDPVSPLKLRYERLLQNKNYLALLKSILLLLRDLWIKKNIHPVRESGVNISNRGTFKSLSRIVCSCLSQMGDNSLVFQMLEKMILDQMFIVEDDKNTTVSISSRHLEFQRLANDQF